VVTVYNLRVADFHTYFVGSEDWGFSAWAHNMYGPFGEGLSQEEQLETYRRWKDANGIEGAPTLEQQRQLRQVIYDLSGQPGTLGEYFDLAGVPDKAMVHLSAESTASLQPGVASRQIWVEAGEVRNLTAEQYRFDVVGAFARGSMPDAQTLAVRLPRPENESLFEFHSERNPAGAQEYAALGVVKPDKFIILPPGTEVMP
jgi:hypothetical protein